MSNSILDRILKRYARGESPGGFTAFDNLPLKGLEELVAAEMVDMKAWNNCDGAGHLFLPFLRRNPSFTADGYMFREDGKAYLRIDGIRKRGNLSKEEVIDFANSFRDAEEMELTEKFARCWYD